MKNRVYDNGIYRAMTAEEALQAEKETAPAEEITPEARIEALESEVKELRLANSVAENQITDLQLALCDVYEATL